MPVPDRPGPAGLLASHTSHAGHAGRAGHRTRPRAYARGRADRSPILSALRLLPPPIRSRGLRVSRWHPDHRIAHLSLTAGRREPLVSSHLRERLAALAAEGYHGAVTAAMGPPDEAVFVGAGFHVVERLHLLQHPLDHALPASPAGSVPTQRARRSDRAAIFAVDHAAFEPFWQLNETMLSEALSATRAVRWRVVRGPDGGVIGYAICGRSGARGYVQRLAVHPDQQGRGVGGALLADGLRWFIRRGAREALVNTQHGNQRSLRLYQRAGFVLQPGGLAVLRLDFDRAPVGRSVALLPDTSGLHRR